MSSGRPGPGGWLVAEVRGDWRAFYAAIGIELPQSARENASVRCFAAPDAHRNEDRHPSCSVSVETGWWKCWGCGATGDGYHAAVAVGLSPRAAMDLLVSFGLAERRDGRYRPERSTRARMERPRTPAERGAGKQRRALAVGEREVERWQRALARSPGLRDRLGRKRLWSTAAIEECGVGVDGRGRVTIPVRGSSGELSGVIHYDPFWSARAGSTMPKVFLDRGSSYQLIPHPGAYPEQREVLLVEGPADMLAARSRGLPAFAVPGTESWRGEWATALAERAVTVAMDADKAGRAAASRIAVSSRRSPRRS